MARFVDENAVLRYLHEAGEPVPFDQIVEDFSGDYADMDKVKDTRSNLQRILIDAIMAGQVLHCNNHFYSATHSKDVEILIDSFVEAVNKMGLQININTEEKPNTPSESTETKSTGA